MSRYYLLTNPDSAPQKAVQIYPLRAPQPQAPPPAASVFRKDSNGRLLLNEKRVLPNAFPTGLDSLVTGEISAKGVEGVPKDYKLGKDDVIVCAFFLCFFLMVLLFVRLKNFFKHRARGFFGRKNTKNSLLNNDDTSLGGGFLFTLVNSALLALCAFPIGTWMAPSLFSRQVPTLTVTALWLLAMCWYGLKLTVYDCINAIFFPSAVRKDWHETYLISMLLTSFLLFPLALALISFNLPIENAWTLSIGGFFFVKLYLLVRGLGIFSKDNATFLHIILYLCTLETAFLLLLQVAGRALLLFLQQCDLDTLREVTYRLI